MDHGVYISIVQMRCFVGYIWCDHWSKNSKLSCRSKGLDKSFLYLSCGSHWEVNRYRPTGLRMSMRDTT